MATAMSTDDNSSSDGEWEVEEQLVLVELSGIIDTDFLSKEKKECKILGIETDQPVLQLDRHVFTGEYKDTIGTAVIFEEQDSGTADDNPKKLKYFCHTFKKLQMNRAFLSATSTDSDTGRSTATAMTTAKATATATTSSPGDVAMETDDTDVPSVPLDIDKRSLVSLVSDYDFFPKDTETDPDDDDTMS
ncbi:general transcription factor 3C polypeptide 6-like [Ptychodera flava]|uniref:general transcription factor 3C polypeptide 6-like n=1 Tax=Ptychodera flava TaxID=63121 RepID=UPI00396A5059